jgi:hypothetical protein
MSKKARAFLAVALRQASITSHRLTTSRAVICLMIMLGSGRTSSVSISTRPLGRRKTCSFGLRMAQGRLEGRLWACTPLRSGSRSTPSAFNRCKIVPTVEAEVCQPSCFRSLPSPKGRNVSPCGS